MTDLCVMTSLCMVSVLVRHVHAMPSAVDAGANESGHKWLPIAANDNT